MKDIHQQLAIDFIKAGITPFALEQYPKAVLNKKAQQAGFIREELNLILDRWNIKVPTSRKQK